MPAFFISFDILLVLLILILLFFLLKKQTKRKRPTEQQNYQEESKEEINEESQTDRDPIPQASDDMTIEEYKGFIGEQVLYHQIKQVQNVGAKVLWDCWLRFPSGTITQADVILIWKSGIYVIESKNWTGCRIYGSYDDEKWTVCWFDSYGDTVRTEKRFNPIKQNAMHVDCIRKMIYNLAPIYSIIAFPDTCKLSKIPAKTKNTAVINYSELRQTIADFHNASDKERLSREDLEKIRNRLKSCSDGVTEEEKVLHNKSIHNRFGNQQ